MRAEGRNRRPGWRERGKEGGGGRKRDTGLESAMPENAKERGNKEDAACSC